MGRDRNGAGRVGLVTAGQAAVSLDDPRVLDFESFASQAGASRFDYAESGADILNSAVSGAARRSIAKLRSQQLATVGARRAALQAEYDRLVAAGELRAPNRIEGLVRTARGMADNEAVQAARRVLAKRAIDYQTYAIRF